MKSTGTRISQQHTVGRAAVADPESKQPSAKAVSFESEVATVQPPCPTTCRQHSVDRGEDEGIGPLFQGAVLILVGTSILGNSAVNLRMS